MTLLESKLEIAARSLATDDDLCKMFDLTFEQLARYRALIDRNRTERMVLLRHERARATARSAGKAKA